MTHNATVAAATVGNDRHARQGVAGLTLAAVGVVFGDIGTSPLYTLKEVFHGPHAIPLGDATVLGVLSLVFWALVILVSIKYVLFIMRADNKGEGGIMALMALVLHSFPEKNQRRVILMAMGLFGAALFYGDGMITPAISVLSAVEGLEVATPAFKPYVIPITLIVLISLFLIQRRGTASVGAMFGPVMCLWFGVLGVLGIISIASNPHVLLALYPGHAVTFFAEHRWHAFVALGAVVLAVTGGEALYADMGHFGRVPISLAWFGLVLPALLLNYFGQGALILAQPEAVKNPFYHLAPDWALYPMVALSTCAAVIASQAVISGTFSVTRQAIQLGYSPRMQIQHTSEKAIGQIYLPLINWALLLAIIALVLGFQSSSNLAAAYGIAVTATMAIDTVLAVVVAVVLWKWPKPLGIAIAIFFLAIDLSFFSANALKFFYGGWFPIVIGLAVFTLLSTWKRGREILFEKLRSVAIDMDACIASLVASPPIRVPGTAVFLTSTGNGVPHALLHNLNHNKVLHERVVVLTVLTLDVPHVPDQDRAEIKSLGHDFYRMFIRYGFKDEPDLPKALMQCAAQGLTFEMMQTSFFLNRETIVSTVDPGMAQWREKLFAGMVRNAGSAAQYFKIPSNRVIELGTQIEI